MYYASIGSAAAAAAATATATATGAADAAGRLEITWRHARLSILYDQTDAHSIIVNSDAICAVRLLNSATFTYIVVSGYYIFM
jgi:hypothetical protein